MSTHVPGILAPVIRRIAVPERGLTIAARAHLDTLTKPLGSLGRLEDLATQLAVLRGGSAEGPNPGAPLRKAVYVFAADHGIVAEGVSAYPASVTRQMVLNFLAGGAAINVLARLHQVAVHIVDVGVDGDFDPHPQLAACKVSRGSRNMLHEPAMTDEEFAAALAVGLASAEQAAAQGYTIVAVGEMGIGNTTAASALTAALCGEAVERVAGRGTGLGNEAYAHKCRVLAEVLARHLDPHAPHEPAEMLRRMGGLEIAAMAGMMLGAASHGIAVVADGFISTAAAAYALAFAPALGKYLFAGHQSEEPGHAVLLAHLGLEPILRLNMRLGEGTGAVLAMPILESALRLYDEMATFASAAVDEATSEARVATDPSAAEAGR